MHLFFYTFLLSTLQHILYSETRGRFSELYMIIQILLAFSEFCMIKILLEVPIQEDMVVLPLPQPVSIICSRPRCVPLWGEYKSG